MQTLTRILCPTDFSSCAQGALRQSLLLAEQHNASVDLVHVVEVPRYVRRDMVGFMGSDGARPLSEIAVDESDRRLKELVDTLDSASSARVTPRSFVGKPADTLVRYAVTQGHDLTVVGATGKLRVAKLILGGVAGKLVRGMPCPVLCVAADTAREFRKILVATDFSDASFHALELAASLGKAQGATLTLAHVSSSAWTVPPNMMLGATNQATHWLELLQREAREALADFAGKAKAHGLEVAEQVLLIGSPAQSLLDHAAEHAYDLIAMGTHGYSGLSRVMLGSVAEAVVHHAACPVLTVSPKTETPP